MALVCHVILQDHILKGLSDFLGGCWSLKASSNIRLVSMSLVVMKI